MSPGGWRGRPTRRSSLWPGQRRDRRSRQRKSWLTATTSFWRPTRCRPACSSTRSCTSTSSPAYRSAPRCRSSQHSGAILDLFSVIRPLVPGQGCLWCNELVSAAKLQEEATSPEQRRRQRYIDEAELAEPSVITLNALAAAHAANDYLLNVTGSSHPAPSTGRKCSRRQARSPPRYRAEARAAQNAPQLAVWAPVV